MKAFEGEADMVFIVTLSQHLSGSYNSAVLGKTLYEEEHGTEKKIHVFSSDSACCGESLIAFKIQELAEAGASFEQIQNALEAGGKRRRILFWRIWTR